MDRLDADHIESYMEAVDRYTTAIASIDGLAYEARTDFASRETSGKSQINQPSDSNKKDYLNQSKDSVIIARDALVYIIEELNIT